jgi:hypothetical protein
VTAPKTLSASFISEALLSLVGEGRALFVREFKTLSGPLKITVAINVERGEKQLKWKAEPTRH